MAPPSFRLDHLAVLFIERLEAARRAHLDDPEAAAAAIRATTAELVAAQAEECRSMLGDAHQAALIEKEGLDSFLPRYTRLALAQNADEARGYGLVLRDGLLSRAVVTLTLFALATVLVRVFPGPVDLVFYLLPIAAPVLPELRAWAARRRYQAHLQELVDDLGRLQDAAERLAPPAAIDERPPPPRLPAG